MLRSNDSDELADSVNLSFQRVGHIETSTFTSSTDPVVKNVFTHRTIA